MAAGSLVRRGNLFDTNHHECLTAVGNERSHTIPKDGKIGVLTIRMPMRSVERFKAMQEAAGATDVEVAKGAFRLYEEALKKARESEDAGGVVYLTVKFPDGRTEEEPIFERAADT